jgi:hypothetical protein
MHDPADCSQRRGSIIRSFHRTMERSLGGLHAPGPLIKFTKTLLEPQILNSTDTLHFL